MKNIDKLKIELEKGTQVRFAVKEDIPRIMDFIKQYWKIDHILANNRSFFEYEFVKNDEVCFVALEREERIEGILGYIPCSNEKQRDLFTVMWKVLEEHNTFGGISLLKYLIENGNCRHIFSSGLNEGTRSIYKYLGYKVDYLSHYYRLNDMEEYKIASIARKEILPVCNLNMCQLKPVSENYFKTNVIYNKNNPYKDTNYYIRRFFNHPIYTYNVYEIFLEEKATNSFIVMREEKLMDRKCIHIVDYVGDIDKLKYISEPIQKMLTENQYEYIDFYQFGIDSAVMEEAGFSLNQRNAENIIPNYFHPFVQKNVSIGIFYEGKINPYIFKADGDQDRPST